MAFVDLCRLCGTDTLNIVRNAIFEGEGRAKKYALKITKCLALQVTFQFSLSAGNSKFDRYLFSLNCGPWLAVGIELYFKVPSY
jgi:hypothetical protein